MTTVAHALCPTCEVHFEWLTEDPRWRKWTCPCCGERLRRITPGAAFLHHSVYAEPTTGGLSCKAPQAWCPVHCPPKPEGACAGPLCTSPAVAKGLCATHLRQQARGRPLTAIRRGPAMERLSVRLPRDVYEALGVEPAGRARAVLTVWARSRRSTE